MQKLGTKKKEIVDFFIKKGVLLSQELLSQFEEEDISEIFKFGKEESLQKITVLNKKTRETIKPTSNSIINWQELEKLNTITKKKSEYEKLAGTMLEGATNKPKTENLEYPESNVEIIYSYDNEPKKREARDFVEYYCLRYRAINKLLKQRQELQNTISINRIRNKRTREQVCVIGIVSDKHVTKNGNCLLTLEDETGSIRVIINKNKPDLFSKSKDIVLDEVVGVVGVCGDNIIFVNNVLFPDIPFTGETKKSNDEAFALFLSDLHVGSKYFLKEDFQRFLRWINQDLGSDVQRHIASKVKYIFMLGDLVDGCGVYPGQEEELEIKDIKDQYKECAELLSKIPAHIKIIICPGNHDAMRVAEPQFPIYKDFSEPLYKLPNAIFVSNPSTVNIHSSKNFSGFDVLIYHGYSFDFYVAEVE